MENNELFDGTGILTADKRCSLNHGGQCPTKLSLLENDAYYVIDKDYNHTDNNFTDEYIEDVNSKIVTLEDITVKGTSVGNFTEGTVIKAGQSITELLKLMLTKSIPPIYIYPTIKLTCKNTIYEYGSDISPELEGVFIKNDAGDLISISLFKDNILIKKLESLSNIKYKDPLFTITDSITYKVIANYGIGDIKNDNLGNPYPEKRIPPGNINDLITITPKMPYWGVASIYDLIPTTEFFEFESKTGLDVKKGSKIKVITDVSSRMVVFAYPNTLGPAKEIFYVDLNDHDNISEFTKINVKIRMLNYETKDYIVYYFISPVVFGAEATFIMTI